MKAARDADVQVGVILRGNIFASFFIGTLKKLSRRAVKQDRAHCLIFDGSVLSCVHDTVFTN